MGRWFAGTSTGAGGTTTIVDSGLASTLKHARTYYGMFFRNNEALHADVGDVQRCADFAKSTGTVTLDAPYTSALGSGKAYQASSFHFDRITDWVNEALRQNKYLERAYLSLALNADFEAITTTAPDNWTYVTAGGGGSHATETGASNVGHGTRAVKVTSGSTLGGLTESDVIDVTPGNSYYFEMSGKGEAGAEADAVLFDETNQVELESEVTTAERFETLYATGQFPSGCRQVTLRGQCNTASGVAYFDFAVIIDTQKRVLPLPSWVEDDGDMVGLFQRRGTEIDESADHEMLYGVQTRGSGILGSGLEVEIDRRWGGAWPVWAEIYRPWPSVSASTDTTPMQRERAMWATIAQMLEERAQNGLAGAVGPARIDLAMARREMVRATARRERFKRRPVGWT